jgi:NAD(P)-dependent dehydrogenase (short-subunit alcohol dehydrogenase family)
MDLGIRGKTALVTGSTAGIGLATARLLAAEGVTVIVNGRTEARVAAAVREVEGAVAAAGADAGGAQVSVRGIAADLGTAAGCAAAIAAEPNVDILVNNMGTFEPKAFEAITDEDWLEIFETNVLSGVRLSRHYVAGMRARDWGRIVFVSSESAVQIPVEMIHYGMTKTAQVSIARGMAESLVGTNVTVNSILPGPTASEGVTAFIGQMAAARGIDRATMEHDFFKTARPSSLLQRFTTNDEIAAMIVYLCSVRASATTGSALRVDGGVIRAIL